MAQSARPSSATMHCDLCGENNVQEQILEKQNYFLVVLCVDEKIGCKLTPLCAFQCNFLVTSSSVSLPRSTALSD